MYCIYEIKTTSSSIKKTLFRNPEKRIIFKVMWSIYLINIKTFTIGIRIANEYNDAKLET